jgi:hypothetical protein
VIKFLFEFILPVSLATVAGVYWDATPVETLTLAIAGMIYSRWPE